MVEVLLDQMLAVVFSQDLDLASKVVVWTLDKLILTDIFMLLYVLSQYPGATLVVAFDDFEKTSLVVSIQIFEHNQRGTLLIRTHDASENAVLLMVVKFTTP